MGSHTYLAFKGSVVNPDPAGSGTFSWIQIRNYCFGSESRQKLKKKQTENKIIIYLLLFCFNCRKYSGMFLLTFNDSSWLILLLDRYKAF